MGRKAKVKLQGLDPPNAVRELSVAASPVDFSAARTTIFAPKKKLQGEWVGRLARNMRCAVHDHQGVSSGMVVQGYQEYHDR
jgi:hypothetical protein